MAERVGQEEMLSHKVIDYLWVVQYPTKYLLTCYLHGLLRGSTVLHIHTHLLTSTYTYHTFTLGTIHCSREVETNPKSEANKYVNF